jgi:hypothetical protein
MAHTSTQLAYQGQQLPENAWYDHAYDQKKRFPGRQSLGVGGRLIDECHQ